VHNQLQCLVVQYIHLIVRLLFADRGSYMTNPNKGKWYRFNDTVVEEFEMTEESLESECFGGKYKAKFSDTCKFLKLHYMLT